MFRRLTYGAHSHQCRATIANHISQSQNTMHFPQLHLVRTRAGAGWIFVLVIRVPYFLPFSGGRTPLPSSHLLRRGSGIITSCPRFGGQRFRPYCTLRECCPRWRGEDVINIQLRKNDESEQFTHDVKDPKDLLHHTSCNTHPIKYFTTLPSSISYPSMKLLTAILATAFAVSSSGR